MTEYNNVIIINKNTLKQVLIHIAREANLENEESLKSIIKSIEDGVSEINLDNCKLSELQDFKDLLSELINKINSFIDKIVGLEKQNVSSDIIEDLVEKLSNLMGDFERAKNELEKCISTKIDEEINNVVEIKI